MPVTMSGMASGIDTDAIIDKLLKVEAQPIRKLEIDKKLYAERKNALTTLRSRLEVISNSAKDLYGFRASYDEKNAISSDESTITAKASKNAEIGLRKILVEQTASTHRIATDNIEEKTELPPGKLKLEVNRETAVVNFRGGKLKSLKDRIEESASEIIQSSYVKTYEDKHVVTIQSRTSGKKGEIKITGDRELLEACGLVSGTKKGESEKAVLTFDNRYFTDYFGDRKIEKQDGSLSIEKTGKSVTIKGVLWKEYTLPVKSPVKKDTVLEFEFSHKGPEPLDENVPNRVELGPDENITVKGIELKGYNVSRIRPEEKKDTKVFDSILGIGVVTLDNGKRTEKIYTVEKDSKGKQEIPIGSDFNGKSVSKIIFYCNEGSATFIDAAVSTPVKDDGGLEPKNVIARAEDARLKLDGIEMRRDKNNDIKDLIKGVTLDIKRASDTAVDIKIEPDLEKPMDRIKKFVESYNNYLDYNKELTKVEKTSKPGDYREAKMKNGPFVGDMTITRLENSLKRTVNGAYPSIAEKPIKMLPQIGISTGKINAEWASIKSGKLVIDEGTLKQAIRENPEGVTLFFGSDSDGDNRTDSGMAYSVVSLLKPYVSSGKNIIASKIDLEEESMKAADDRIAKYEEHLKGYEEKLRRKFATMEKAITGSKNQKSWLNNQLGNKEDNR